jgi:hypothetical protein
MPRPRRRPREDTATTMKVNFRSLRDSGITWEALAQTPVDRIQARAGHEEIGTTSGYVKAAEDLRGEVRRTLRSAALRPAREWAKVWAKSVSARSIREKGSGKGFPWWTRFELSSWRRHPKYVPSSPPWRPWPQRVDRSRGGRRAPRSRQTLPAAYARDGWTIGTLPPLA